MGILITPSAESYFEDPSNTCKNTLKAAFHPLSTPEMLVLVIHSNLYAQHELPSAKEWHSAFPPWCQAWFCLINLPLTEGIPDLTFSILPALSPLPDCWYRPQSHNTVLPPFCLPVMSHSFLPLYLYSVFLFPRKLALTFPFLIPTHPSLFHSSLTSSRKPSLIISIYFHLPLVDQLVKNLPAMQDTWV